MSTFTSGEVMRSSLGTHSRDSTPLLGQRGVFKSGPYRRPPWYRDVRFYMNLVRRGLAEFLATGLFVFVTVSSMSNIQGSGWYSKSSAATLAALASGFSLASLMGASLHVSGGHLNPAVTLGVFVAGGINVVAAVVYFVMQIAGSLAGAACVLAYDTTSNDSVVDYGLTILGDGYKPWQGILVEMLMSLMLVMVFIHTTMEHQRPENKHNPGTQTNTTNVLAPIVTGFSYAAGIMASFSITGGSLNPARSFGPAAVSSSVHRWTYHYIYWIGPILGALMAGMFYRLLLSSRPLIPISDSTNKER